MKFDIQTHAWLYNDWLWKKIAHPRKRGGGGIAENAMIPDYIYPTYANIEHLPEWIESIYLSMKDKRYIISLLGKTIVVS